MAFVKTELPPIEREGRQRVTLDESEAKNLVDTLMKDVDSENPWLTDDKDYNTRHAAQARVLFYRNELHRLHSDKVEVPKQIGSRVVPAEDVGGPKGKFRFALRYRKSEDISDFDQQKKEVAKKAKKNGNAS